MISDDFSLVMFWIFSEINYQKRKKQTANHTKSTVTVMVSLYCHDTYKNTFKIHFQFLSQYCHYLWDIVTFPNMTSLPSSSPLLSFLIATLSPPSPIPPLSLFIIPCLLQASGKPPVHPVQVLCWCWWTVRVVTTRVWSSCAGLSSC